MALKRTKKKKGGLKSLRSTGGGSSVETSPLRPVHVEKIAPCVDACPQGTNIRRILVTIGQAEKFEKDQDEAFTEAFQMLSDKNPLAAVCGRVCPHPCEDGCNRAERDSALSINAIERFIGDYGIEKNVPFLKVDDAGDYKEKIAVIGSGPAGLSCAFHLARRGYPVTLFEAFAETGGMLRYGIPAYRLPRDLLDKEVQRILDLGVELKCNTAVGRDISYDDVKKEYSAVFVGIGAHKGRGLRVEGEDASNFMTGVAFLNRANQGEKVDVGDKVVVIGGGDTAIDAARMARRLGADVSILYRRTRAEMPAIEEEIVGAEEEGVKLEILAAPVGIVRDGDKARAMLFQKCELGEPDSSGRRRPVPIEGSDFEVEATCFISAISQEPDFDGLDEVGNPKDWVKADEWMQTEHDHLYGGGDVLNLGLVTGAIYQGRRAALTIHENLRGIEHSKPKNPAPLIKQDKLKLTYYEEKARFDCGMMPADARLGEPEAEISTGLTREQVIEEARRCMSCGLCFDCGECWSYCQDQAIIKPLAAGEKYKFKMEFCNGCKKCAEQCPCGYIEMHMPGQEPVYDK